MNIISDTISRHNFFIIKFRFSEKIQKNVTKSHSYFKIYNSKVSNNKASLLGGGIYVSGSPNGLLYNTIISDNSAVQAGGGMHIWGDTQYYGRANLNIVK